MPLACWEASSWGILIKYDEDRKGTHAKREMIGILALDPNSSKICPSHGASVQTIACNSTFCIRFKAAFETNRMVLQSLMIIHRIGIQLKIEHDIWIEEYDIMMTKQL